MLVELEYEDRGWPGGERQIRSTRSASARLFALAKMGPALSFGGLSFAPGVR
jgi:hypothetical protein